jgi:hypothetical protein
MKRIFKSKYRNWFVDRVSLTLGLISIDISRHWILPGENLETLGNKMKAKIVFGGVNKIVFENFAGNSEIDRFEQRKNEDGKVVYTLRCLPGSLLEITADGYVEIPF